MKTLFKWSWIVLLPIILSTIAMGQGIGRGMVGARSFLTAPVFRTSITAKGLSGANACVYIIADAGEDDADKWRYCVGDNGNATLESKTTGSWVAVWTVSSSGAFSVIASLLPDVSGGADIGSTLLEWGDVYIATDKQINWGDAQEFNLKHESVNLHLGFHDSAGNEFFTLEDVGSETAANIFGSLDIHKIAGSAAATSYESFGIHMNVGVLDTTSTMHGAVFDLVGSSAGEKIAIGVFPGLDVLIQHTGSFVTPDQGPGAATFAGRLVDPGGSPVFTEGIDTETLFVSDNDEIYIGSTGTFTQLKLILTTPANQSIGQPPNDAGEYYFRNTGNTWVQFFPLDGTDGFTMDGIVSWDATDLTAWKSDYDPFSGNSATGYWIKIKRTRGASLTTTPVPTTIKILDPTNFSWDSSGNVAVNTIELGHATDTTITRPSGGDIAVEGNIVYRAGGTDVPVADGGTGGGSASITLFNNITGYTASGATGTTSTNLVFSASPTIVTPAISYKYDGVNDAARTNTTLSTDYIVAFTALTASRNYQISSEDIAIAGRVFIIKDESGAAGTFAITVSTEGAENIDGAATISIEANYGSVQLYSNGSHLFVF